MGTNNTDTSGYDSEFIGYNPDMSKEDYIRENADLKMQLSLANNFIQSISKGENIEKITEIYSGNTEILKESINETGEIINNVLSELNILTKSAVEGKLDARGDSGKFPGGWGTIISEVNKTLDAVIGPLNVSAEYVERISRGDIPERITDTYNGDFNEIKNNLNLCIDAVNLLVEDAGMLAKAGVEGRLDTRADVSRHTGDFAAIVKGVNDTLDAVIGPLNVSAEYVERISRGDIPERITDTYNGDFNEIKNNLNLCIDAVNLLVEDAGMLAKAGVEGRLDTRADASRHSGDFAAIVKGVNDTLDAVIGPLNVSAEYVERISRGDIPERITDTYNGDFNEIKNNLNLCIDGLGGLLEADKILQNIKLNDFTEKTEGSYSGIFKEVCDALNDVVDHNIYVQETVLQIADGNLERLPAYRSIGRRCENDKLLPAYISMMGNIQLLVDDTRELTEAAIQGRLDARADSSKLNGEYKNLIEGVNDTLDAVIGPLNVSAEYVERISRGDIPERITDTYNGDFNEIKNNLNLCIDAVNLLVEDAGMLAKAGVEGRLDTRADASRHSGDFAAIVKGVNDTLDAVIGPLNVSAEYVERISRGDIPERITDTYNGDFNEIKNNLNLCIDAVNLLVEDAGMLAKAGVEGRLDTRADASRHSGDFAAIVKGVNDTLDAVIGPLNVSAEYVERISRGDIPERITDTYNGDFNEIKNNLNLCIDAVNLLVEDAGMLTKAAKEGRITVRADVSRHSGDFAAIVKGVNETLDAIVEPVKKVIDIANRVGVSILDTSKGIGEVTRAIEQVAVNTQQTTDDSRRQIEFIEDVAREISDLSASIEEIASTSQEVKVSAEGVTSLGQEAKKLGNVANNKMQEVEKISLMSVEEIDALNRKMVEISNIIKLITDISNQTNLLALNAAIEAARAGEHGRGFAVVAGEVRNLAGDSKKATDSIEKLITGIQSDSSKTAESMKLAYNEIQSGIESVNETIIALNSMVNGAENAGRAINEIAKATEDQADATNRVMQTMEKTTQVTHNNMKRIEDIAALTEEVSASSEEVGSGADEVAGMAEDLKKSVDVFKV
ncbi:methyl-accepting chemotaxis protein [Methanoplanus limicola]|uniref:Methyl-accepting chemotaxis sensory transducer n=1 Tax=Methanoplanus limicola DSM 2279 TaxID=937775 RepID=H1YX88_9EURY|nr:methyl-accepting chemotaxis protein [Methanoplanus limicola]EHQ35891.1 methyl-accepting chemotaxis sensory transducer [Methanoplanus limicola DSM 2279]